MNTCIQFCVFLCPMQLHRIVKVIYRSKESVLYELRRWPWGHDFMLKLESSIRILWILLRIQKDIHCTFNAMFQYIVLTQTFTYHFICRLSFS